MSQDTTDDPKVTTCVICTMEEGHHEWETNYSTIVIIVIFQKPFPSTTLLLLYCNNLTYNLYDLTRHKVHVGLTDQEGRLVYLYK